MLCEVVASGVSSRVKSGSVDGEKVKGDMDFDVVLCQSELMERALQLCHLLPPGYLPVSLNSYLPSHTQPCVSLSGCLIGLNSHSSCSATPIFGRERSQIFVCTFHLSVSVWWNLKYALHKTDFSGPRLSDRIVISFLLCSPFVSTAVLSCLCSLRVCFLPCFLAEKIPTPVHIPAGNLLFCSSDLRHIITTRLMAVVSSLRYVMGWQCLCCWPCLTNKYLHLSVSLFSHVSHLKVLLWMLLTVWSAAESWLWKK